MYPPQAPLLQCRMLLRRDTRVAATQRQSLVTTVFAVWLAVLATPVIGQSDADVLPIEAPLVDRTHGERAYRLIAQWLKSGTVPRDGAPPIRVTGLIGAKVTLRNAGFTLGAATTYRKNLDRVLDQPGPAIDLVPLLRDATEQALRAVNQRLDDVQLRQNLDGIELPNERPTAREIGGIVLIDVQLGHRLESVRISPDAPPGSVYGKFAPGYHGLRVMVPNAMQPLGSILWPASALAANISPDSQLKGLLSAQGYKPAALTEIARPKGPILQRFEVIHCVQPRRDEPMARLVRGNILLSARAIDAAALEGMADRLYAHLTKRFLVAAVRGTYHPTLDRYDPALASEEQVALACYAITRHERFLTRRNDNLDRGANKSSQKLAMKLARAAVAAETNQSPAVTALVLLTLSDSLAPQGGAELRQQLGKRLLSLRNGRDGFRASLDADAEKVNKATAAAIAAALAALFEQTRDPELGIAVQEILQDLWAQAPNATSLYWFANAYHRVPELLAGPQGSADSAQRTLAGDLAQQVATLSEQQVIEPPIVGPEDVLGGFELHRGEAQSPPTPDWTSASLLAFVAVCLQDGQISKDQDTNGWILTASLAARFIGQMMMDRGSCYYVHSVDKALNGVRRSLWDNKLAIPPTAMSLLAVVELQEAVVVLSEQQ